MLPPIQIFTFLFLMLGPFKVLGPFTQVTQGADPKLINKIALLAFVYSSLALLLASLVGENVLEKFDIPVPILAIAGGLILFLVALLNILKQFDLPEESAKPATPPSLRSAVIPIAFPSIVTPHGIAAIIVFLALSPDPHGKLLVGGIAAGIMVVNLIFMLINRYIFKVLLLILPILGAILGVVQVALGLKIMYSALMMLLH